VSKRLGVDHKTRSVQVFSNMAPENNVCVYNSDIVTLERAIKERVFFVREAGQFVPPPLPKAGVIEKRLRSFASQLAKHLPSTTPIGRHEFANLYRGRRQKVYQQAAESLMTLGVQRRDSFIKPFVKAEKGKPDSAPRVIQPRSPRYNVEVGRFLKPLEERIYEAIAGVWGEIVVMKGFNARAVARHLRAKWDKYRRPVAIGLDASRFDQHVSQFILTWEHSIWLKCFRNKSDRDELARLLKWQLDNLGFGYCRDGTLRYRVSGCRMSGDMNTASGNCLIMCALVWAYAKVKGIQCSLVNNGDDCVVIMESRDRERFSVDLTVWFREMGFTMKVEDPVFDFESIEFCQSHPVSDGEGYVMVRGLRGFVKDAYSLVPLRSSYMLHTWLASVGDAGMSLTGGIPIWQEYYAAYQRMAGAQSSKRRRRGARYTLDQSAFETGMMMSAIGMDRRYGHVTDLARYSFWLAFGITPDEQVAIEDVYRSYGSAVIPALPGQEPQPCNGFLTSYESGDL